MGTLQNQPERNHRTVTYEGIIEHVNEMHRQFGTDMITLDQALYAERTMEMQRANDIAIADHDAKDEQLAGFGELITKLIGAVESLAR